MPRGTKDYTAYIGKKFNKLTFVEMAGRREDNRVKARFLCDCGNEKIIHPSLAICNKTKSCGCAVKGKGGYNRLPFGEASLNSLFKGYQKGANERGLVFELSKEQFREITSSNCVYCGIPPSQVKKARDRIGILEKNYYLYNGIDRVKNDEGYIIENCVTCCSTCNTMKMAMSKENFFNQIIRIYNVSNLEALNL